MDAERITELLRAHGNAITWESHLAFVERMSQWEPEEILDYQDSLLGHFSRGAWVNTSQNRTITLPNTGTFDASSVDEQIELLEFSISHTGLLTPDQVAGWQQDLDRLRALRPAIEAPIDIPRGLIGVPLHPWMTPAFGRKDPDEPLPRASLKRFINNTDQGNFHDLRLVLRAAPWAYHRRTGKRLVDVEPCSSEEFHTTGRNEWFTTVVGLRRGGDRVEYLAASPGPSAGYATLDRNGCFRAFARLLGASIESIGARPVDGLQVEEHSWLVHDAQVISDRAAERESAKPNALSAAMGALLFATGTDRSQHPRLDEDAFWNLIALVDDELSDESIARLTTALAKKPIKSIIGFHETLTDVLYRLDRPELTKPPGSTEPSVMSDDVFLYARCAVVARGAKAVQSVLEAGGIVEEDWNGELGESLLSVAPEAFELKSGEPFDHETEFSYESASNAVAWGGDPLRSGDLPIAAFGVRSHSTDADGRGRERVRYWLTPSRDDAVASHDAVERGLWGENYGGVMDAVALPPADSLSVTKALGRVSYFRPVGG